MKIINTLLTILFVSLLMIEEINSQINLDSPQTVGITQESIDIQTDRQLYVTGEVIWFKIIALDYTTRQASSHSKVGYLELIAPDGTIITRVKTELVNGQSVGSITLPKSLSSNLYTLRSYTCMMRNFDADSFANKQVYILNAEQSLLANNSNDAISSIISPNEVEGDNEFEIKLEISNPKVHQRELVELKIKTSKQLGITETSNLSISVSIPNQTFPSNISAPVAKSATTSPTKEDFPPESLGMKLTGRVLNSISNPAEEGIRVYLSFPGKTAMVYTTYTDGEGRFDFLLPRLYGQRQVVLQLDPKIEAEHSIVLDDDFHPSIPSKLEPFVLPDELMTIANRTLANAQIADSYTSFEPQAVYLSNDKFTALPFYGEPDRVYNLDEYTRFPLPEFFYEVVPEVAVYGKYGNNTLGIVNDYHINKKELSPLLLVDGVPVFEQDHFLSINNKLIVSSEIVRDPYWLNTILYNGIIQILSIDGDARSFPLPTSALRTNFLTFLPQRQFATPDYSAEVNVTLPDFRNTLYWNPSITTDQNGEASISFYTSDAIGEYEIRVEAINNSGQKGQTSKSIEVLKIIK